MSGYLDYVGSQLELEFVSISSHVNNCPFRGCAGDWVKLGVAKRHGAVLGDKVSKMADENTKVQLVESDIPGAELPKPA